MYNLNRYNFYIQSAVDIAAIILAFFSAMWWKIHIAGFVLTGFYQVVYQRFFLVNILFYLVTAFMILHRNSDFITRSTAEEFVNVFKTVASVLNTFFIYVFITKTSVLYSRGFVVVYSVLFAVICFVLRIIIKKKLLPIITSGKGAEQLVIIGPCTSVTKKIKAIKSSKDWRFHLKGVVVTDRSMEGEYIDGVEVIADRDDAVEKIKIVSADSIMLLEQKAGQELSDLVNEFAEMGKTVHVNIDEYDASNRYSRFVDEIGGNPVISYYPVQHMARRDMLLKRVIDIIISITLLPFYIVLLGVSTLFVKLGNGGPAIINKVRIGRNGRRFYMHRFRIMRADAKSRIKANKSPYTIWGVFLRKTHLDGFPMILNVLSADMSIVGPKAPTIHEFIKDIPVKRQNLVIKPGIIGIWSFDSDEEQLIRQERDYIENWNFIKDLYITGKTILRYLLFLSSRSDSDYEFKEEYNIIEEYFEARQPLKYDHGLYSADHNIGYLAVKRIFDIAFSLVLIILLSPLLLILALLVFLEDGGAPIYAHIRVGMEGRRIKVYKFRSMRQDAGDLKKLLTPEQLEQYKREFKVDDDPRRTKIGNILRKTSLDELPQLFNILGGSLSFVGPRPIVEKETHIYGDQIGKLLSVKPGLTGYWQAYARNNATYESGERQQMEMYYVDHQSLGLDIKVLFKTVGSVLKREGAK